MLSDLDQFWGYHICEQIHLQKLGFFVKNNFLTFSFTQDGLFDCVYYYIFFALCPTKHRTVFGECLCSDLSPPLALFLIFNFYFLKEGWWLYSVFFSRQYLNDRKYLATLGFRKKLVSNQSQTLILTIVQKTENVS